MPKEGTNFQTECLELNRNGMEFFTSRQIEAARIAATRYMKREGQLWIKIFPDKPITKKPLEVRMGKGKGAVEYWVAVVKPGRIMFEVGGVPMDVAKEALSACSTETSSKNQICRCERFRSIIRKGYAGRVPFE